MQRSGTDCEVHVDDDFTARAIVDESLHPQGFLVLLHSYNRLIAHNGTD
jgi:hypothetical protein